jgi:isoquinoline 1-oxidoreductase beta subunit
VSVAARMQRREFLKAGAALGGGLLISLYVPEFVPAARAADSAVKPVALNAFVRIGSDESVTVISNHSEMGQGIYTSLPMLLNEELEADWARIRVESSPVDAVYNHTVFGLMMTGGSTTTNSEYDRFRKMGAMARIMLITAAAQSWNVDPQTCRAEKGYVIHTPSGRRASYGSLAEAAARIAPPKDIPLKEPKDFTLVGTPVHRLDTPSKTNGTAQFGLDVYIPGMLTAVVARAPVFGGKVVSYNADGAKAIPGRKRGAGSFRRRGDRQRILAREARPRKTGNYLG